MCPFCVLSVRFTLLVSFGNILSFGGLLEMKNKKVEKLMIFPTNQIFTYLRSGKFEALSDDWIHESMSLTFDYEFIVVTEGTLYLRYMDEDFIVEKGDYLFLPPSDSKRVGIKKAYCCFYWIHFTVNLDSFPARIFPGEINSFKRANCFLLPQSANVPRPERLIIHMKRLQDLDRDNYPEITLNASLTAIITELYGQINAEIPNENDSLNNKQIYSDIVDYVKRNISTNITINDIADYFGYSSKYLSRVFSEVRGLSLKQFIMSQKIETAAFYLTDSDRRITEIAREVGFTDVHNFSRTFKKIKGLSPSEYRNTYAKRILYHV